MRIIKYGLGTQQELWFLNLDQRIIFDCRW